MSDAPSTEEQIAALLRVTARLEAGGVVMAYPDDLPALNGLLASYAEAREDRDSAIRCCHVWERETQRALAERDKAALKALTAREQVVIELRREGWHGAADWLEGKFADKDA